MAYALFFVKGDVFISIISDHCIQCWFIFYVVDAMKYMDVGVKFILGM